MPEWKRVGASRKQAKVGTTVKSPTGAIGTVTSIPTSSKNDHTVTVKWENGYEGRVNLMNVETVKPSRRNKLANKIQKEIAKGSPGVKLPTDPFQGFRDAVPDTAHLKKENAIPATPPKSDGSVDAAVNRARAERGMKPNPPSGPTSQQLGYDRTKYEEALEKQSKSPTIKEHLDRLSQQIREDFRPEDDEDDDPGRPTSYRDIPPDRLAKEIAYAREHGDDFVTVKIPSYSEVSINMDTAMALHAHFEGDPQDMHNRRMARIAAGGGRGGVEGQPRVPAGSPTGGQWTKK